VRGDQSVGVLEFLNKAKDYLANPDGVCLYVNFTANPDLMPPDRIPPGLKIIVPRYHGPHDPPQVPAGVVVFGHQYGDNENTPPFGPSDINQAKVPLNQFLKAWGINGGVPVTGGVRGAVVTPPQPEGLTDEDRALLDEVRDLLYGDQRPAKGAAKTIAKKTAKSIPAKAPAKAAAKRAAPTRKAAKKAPAKAAKKVATQGV
jgi:hypothetical protein